MKLWNWFLTLIGKRFPLPPRHILTYEEISRYWESMDPDWQNQCTVIVLRLRRQPLTGIPNIWNAPALPLIASIRHMWGIAEHRQEPEPFTIRIDREWEVQPGIKKKEEVCIANFEL